jgi:hypothetical protein
MKTAKRLRQARALVADRRCWTRGQYARYRDGHPCSSRSPRAARFCLCGAVGRVAESYSQFRALWSAVSEVGGSTAFNDTHSHAEVLALLDAAIAKAEGEAERSGDA